MEEQIKIGHFEDGWFLMIQIIQLLHLIFILKREKARGIQTGIGQCITYLNTFSCSYLMCPNEVEGFKISNYLKNVFEENIYGKLPIGLIEHSKINGKMNLKLLVDISERLDLNPSHQVIS